MFGACQARAVAGLPLQQRCPCLQRRGCMSINSLLDEIKQALCQDTVCTDLSKGDCAYRVKQTAWCSRWRPQNKEIKSKAAWKKRKSRSSRKRLLKASAAQSVIGVSVNVVVIAKIELAFGQILLHPSFPSRIAELLTVGA